MFFTHFDSANQQSSLSIRWTSTINTQSEHKTSKSVIAEIDSNKTMLVGKGLGKAILASEIYTFSKSCCLTILTILSINIPGYCK